MGSKTVAWGARILALVTGVIATAACRGEQAPAAGTVSGAASQGPNQPLEAAKTRPQVGPSWSQYLDDLAPNLEKGHTGLGIDPKFWDKYDKTLVEWDGTLSSCAKDAKGKVSCEVAMPPRTLKVKGGPGDGMPIGTVSVSTETTDGERWQALTPGSQITFRATTLSTVMVLPDSKSGKNNVLVGIVLTDGKIIESR